MQLTFGDAEGLGKRKQTLGRRRFAARRRLSFMAL
ncbi:hypothetical protein J155_02533 [Xanthomonas citri pv. citri]|nr:Hypothetical Protein XCAW_02036 [Xanthomonas citri subsp. citri Aw12879]AJD68964.1 hypothetical protein J151_02542 [Xanthomonas citri subsp. citri A306]AJY82489.1 hypothetical protein J159_02530 [Xanthomonas citri pv. citri]AJY86913.1 hypothetical protein J158_02532 [Xanthomonas citri subsp. citri UI6]UDI81870.1 hypothetical protein XCM_12770 [Xanthomonas citri pv. mangiferaeindicae]UIE42638.1 hypothetical protein FICKIIDM_01746 [Xanthomonas citri pv. punicae]